MGLLVPYLWLCVSVSSCVPLIPLLSVCLYVSLSLCLCVCVCVAVYYLLIFCMFVYFQADERHWIKQTQRFTNDAQPYTQTPQ